MRPRLTGLVGLLALLAVSAANAQIKLDMAKMTCRQFLVDRNIAPQEKVIAAWFSGYFNAKSNNTVIDIETVASNKDKVEDYCRMNLDVTIMDAVKAALEQGK